MNKAIKKLRLELEVASGKASYCGEDLQKAKQILSTEEQAERHLEVEFIKLKQASNYPLGAPPYRLNLKVGAIVMLIKN